MIVGRLETWRERFRDAPWPQVFEFLEALSESADEGRIEIRGEEIFARVMCYETRGPDEGILETHRRYVDVQSTLIGAEGVDWFPRDSLELREPYDEERDVAFYHRPEIVPARVDVYRGMYVVLFPEDAHMAQQVVGDGVKSIKKVVVKVHVDLL
ncbi:MAG: YhcH/YjgK/YiaL family protein [Candidatus Hydrogenedentes bacterium]|nr:YhcH/YjgK/YiaL family protein [Candidatus Hydrogenedentota bacterium]